MDLKIGIHFIKQHYIKNLVVSLFQNINNLQKFVKNIIHY